MNINCNWTQFASTLLQYATKGDQKMDDSCYVSLSILFVYSPAAYMQCSKAQGLLCCPLESCSLLSQCNFSKLLTCSSLPSNNHVMFPGTYLHHLLLPIVISFVDIVVTNFIVASQSTILVSPEPLVLTLPAIQLMANCLLIDCMKCRWPSAY